MIDGKSYFVKLYLKVKEGGRDAMADVLQSCSSANLFVHSKSKDGILVDVYGKVASNALEDNNHFSIVSFLKEKNLIYEN
jgi:hypothetical protein